MNDITIIYLTTNELPEKWVEFHRECLIEALDGSPLIIMGCKTPNWKEWKGMGLALYIPQDKPKSPSNVYRQLLRGAKLATTKYIAVAEDDTLYHKEHFNFRPKRHRIAYNMNHWSLFTWGESVYNWRNRKGNYSMIGEREFVIECLEERFAKYPDGTLIESLGKSDATWLNTIWESLSDTQKNFLPPFLLSISTTMLLRWMRHREITASVWDL